MHYNLILKRLDNKLPNFLDLEEIKKYLRVDFNEDDDVLVSLAIAVCEKAESFMSINLLERSVKQVVSGVFTSSIKLYQEPVIKVENVLIGDNAISSQEWIFNLHNNYVDFNSGVQSSSQITIDYISGFTQRNISHAIKIGILEHIEFLYDGHSLNSDIPSSSIALYSVFRNLKVWR